MPIQDAVLRSLAFCSYRSEIMVDTEANGIKKGTIINHIEQVYPEINLAEFLQFDHQYNSVHNVITVPKKKDRGSMLEFK